MEIYDQIEYVEAVLECSEFWKIHRPLMEISGALFKMLRVQRLKYRSIAPGPAHNAVMEKLFEYRNKIGELLYNAWN